MGGRRPAAACEGGATVAVSRQRGGCATTAVLFLLLVLLGAAGSGTAASIMGEECDWSGSGLDGTGRAVTPVYLRCSSGRLKWAYPRGALRVVLRLGASGRDFRACVKASGESAGARVLIEAPGRLAPLLDDRAGAPTRCFQSRQGQASLYVEASGVGSQSHLAREVASLTYHLEPQPRDRTVYDPADDCRPCTKAEMGQAYCTSDLVTRGIIQSVRNLDDQEVAEMTVKVTKLLRHSTEDNNPESNDLEEVAGNSVSSSSPERDRHRVKVNVPLHCGARHGPGEFVIMARRKLGDLTLTCAPRLEDWADIVQSVNQGGDAHCVLRS